MKANSNRRRVDCGLLGRKLRPVCSLYKVLAGRRSGCCEVHRSIRRRQKRQKGTEEGEGVAAKVDVVVVVVVVAAVVVLVEE